MATFGSTCRKTHTFPSGPSIFTVPPKIWPVSFFRGFTSTILPSIGARTALPPGENQSKPAW